MSETTVRRPTYSEIEHYVRLTAADQTHAELVERLIGAEILLDAAREDRDRYQAYYEEKLRNG